MIQDQERLAEFIEAWQVCTVAEVGTMFGLTTKAASAQANRLRVNGVPLRYHRKSRKTMVDYEALAEVARGAQQEAGQ